ncbi:hypothetical protein [Micromonospora sp. NPDC050695]|uniref:hypothetical protein n=1 Tax=Micromonospora sp. NPDC050695 TaxID=3154938 RepID=UPI0033DE0538
MGQSKSVPKNVASWTAEQVSKLKDLVVEASTISDDAKHDQATWTLELLAKLSEIEKISRRGIHLLTASALNYEVATATEVAKASGVTVSTVQNRNGGPITREVWKEATSRRTRT